MPRTLPYCRTLLPRKHNILIVPCRVSPGHGRLWRIRRIALVFGGIWVGYHRPIARYYSAVATKQGCVPASMCDLLNNCRVPRGFSLPDGHSITGVGQFRNRAMLRGTRPPVCCLAKGVGVIGQTLANGSPPPRTRTRCQRSNTPETFPGDGRRRIPEAGGRPIRDTLSRFAN